MRVRRKLNAELAWPLIAFGFAGIAFAAATLLCWMFVRPLAVDWFLWVLLNGFLGYISVITGLDLRRQR